MPTIQPGGIGSNKQWGKAMNREQRREEEKGCLRTLLIVAALAASFILMNKFPVLGRLYLTAVGLGFTCLGLALLVPRLVWRAEFWWQALLLLPFRLIIAYGLIGLCFTTFLARHVVPEHWEWPVGSDSTITVLPSGLKAVALEGAPRIQIYDGDDKYLGGWFVLDPQGGDFGFVRDNPDVTGPFGRETVLVNFYRPGLNILYDLNGRIVRQDQAGGETVILVRTRPPAGSYPYPWYKWPLVFPGNAASLAFLGMAAVCAMVFSGIFRPRHGGFGRRPPKRPDRVRRVFKK